MTEYKIGKSVVRIHGKEPDNLKEATEKFMKKVIICRKRNEKSKISS